MSRAHCLELARRIGRDPEDIVAWWAERAAIREFDGGQPRDTAERDALEDIRSACDVTSLAGGQRIGPQAATATEETARKAKDG